MKNLLGAFAILAIFAGQTPGTLGVRVAPHPGKGGRPGPPGGDTSGAPFFYLYRSSFRADGETVPAGVYPDGRPAHESMEDLVDYAHDFDRWSIWTNAILDPEHA